MRVVRKLRSKTSTGTQNILDGVDRSVSKRAHGTRNQTNQGCLHGWQTAVRVLWLPLLQLLFQLSVSSEVSSWVTSTATKNRQLER